MVTSVFTDQQKHQLCADTVYSLEDLPGTMNDRNGSSERDGIPFYQLDFIIYIYIYIYIYSSDDKLTERQQIFQ